jgi:hypothetical protein
MTPSAPQKIEEVSIKANGVNGVIVEEIHVNGH